MNSRAEDDRSGVEGGAPGAFMGEGAPVGGAAFVGETSVDAFYCGRFHLVQPKGRGFRAGLDALLLAASIPPGRQGAAVDLGAGAGALALAVATRCPGLTIALVENQPPMADLARRTLAWPANAELTGRLSVVETDVLGRRHAREAAGLLDGAFAAVLTNPPFHPEGGRRSPDPLRAGARALAGAEVLAGWMRTAAALLETGGLFAMIARPDNLPALLDAAKGRLGDLRIAPVHSDPAKPAIRILLHARKGSRAPMSMMPPVRLHDVSGGVTDLARAISDGNATLDLGLS